MILVDENEGASEKMLSPTQCHTVGDDVSTLLARWNSDSATHSMVLQFDVGDISPLSNMFNSFKAPTVR